MKCQKWELENQKSKMDAQQLRKKQQHPHLELQHQTSPITSWTTHTKKKDNSTANNSNDHAKPKFKQTS